MLRVYSIKRGKKLKPTSKKILTLLESEYPFEVDTTEIIKRVNYSESTISIHLRIKQQKL